MDEHLYTFPYDWRKRIELSARRLRDLIDHVHGKLAEDGKEPQVYVVTHSMGGLVLRSALSLRNPDPFQGIRRIVFIAPPFRGSFSIPKNLIAGEKNGLFSDEEDFRKLARTFPSVYQMIPSFPDAAVDADDGTDLDLFDLCNWQENVVSNGEFNRRFLADAEAFRRGTGAHFGGQSDAPMLSDDELRQHAKDILILLTVGHATTY